MKSNNEKLELILASSNQNKVKEFNELFKDSSIKISSPPHSLDVEESGTTFAQNSYLKAKAYYDKFQVPSIADDSGLIVDSLPNELGVYSARFGGDKLTSHERCQLLLKKLEGYEDRSAKFICNLCVILNKDETYFFEGSLVGKISQSLKGEGGFGFDPVFLPEGVDGEKTLAEVYDWKQKNSHRAKAFQFLLNFFKKRDCQN